MCSEHNVTNLKDYVTIKFRNGSQFDVVGALDSTRGGRKNGGLIDEVRDHEEEPINEVVLPLLNVSRRLPSNNVNPKEPNQQRIFIKILCAYTETYKLNPFELLETPTA